ncbi:hypothetical protein BY458DRAFT_446752, partial [Sporodiniella umbellata]
DSQGEGCVYAIDTIKADENFATVPFKICIHEKIARSEFPTLNEFSGRLLQSLFLAQQKMLGNKSFYFPYINILPKKVMTALYFDEDDMVFLAKTNLETALTERKATLKSDFDRLLKNIPDNIQISISCIYSSRAFPYKLVDPLAADDTEVLFPLVDALNHKPNTKITWSRNGDSDTGCMSFISGQEYPKGAEIYNNYGPKVLKKNYTYSLVSQYNWFLV